MGRRSVYTRLLRSGPKKAASLVPASGEGWESAVTNGTAAEGTLVSTADTWGATDTAPAAEGTLIPTEDSWGTAEPQAYDSLMSMCL